MRAVAAMSVSELEDVGVPAQQRYVCCDALTPARMSLISTSLSVFFSLLVNFLFREWARIMIVFCVDLLLSSTVQHLGAVM
jgi:hypothetical protein